MEQGTLREPTSPTAPHDGWVYAGWVATRFDRSVTCMLSSLPFLLLSCLPPLAGRGSREGGVRPPSGPATVGTNRTLIRSHPSSLSFTLSLPPPHRLFPSLDRTFSHTSISRAQQVNVQRVTHNSPPWISRGQAKQEEEMSRLIREARH